MNLMAGLHLEHCTEVETHAHTGRPAHPETERCLLMPGALQPCSLLGGRIPITQANSTARGPNGLTNKRQGFICFYLIKHSITCLIVYEGI